MKHFDIMIVGVGGQGTLLASRILGMLAIDMGMDVKVSEVHGMAQRGGSVVTYVRMGDSVGAPLVGEAGADFILAFEQLEAARALPYLKKQGILIANTQKIAPMPVISGAVKYPEGLIGKLEGYANLIAFDALALAEQAGAAKAVNLVLLGRLSTLIGLPEEAWMEAIEKCVPEKLLKVNLRAFEMGRKA